MAPKELADDIKVSDLDICFIYLIIKFDFSTSETYSGCRNKFYHLCLKLLVSEMLCCSNMDIVEGRHGHIKNTSDTGILKKTLKS